MVPPSGVVDHDDLAPIEVELLFDSFRGYPEVAPGGDHVLVVVGVYVGEYVPSLSVGVPDEDVVDVLDHVLVEGLFQVGVSLDFQHTYPLV